MNDTFSLPRFGLLLRKFTKEHYVTYLLYAAATFGVLSVVYGLTVIAVLQGRFPQDAGIVYFLIGLMLGASAFSASFYSFFKNKAKGIQFLNLPASHTEKLTLGFIFTQLVFFAAFLGIFYLVDHLMCGIYNRFHTTPANLPPQFISLYVAEPLNFNLPAIKVAIMIAFVLSAVSHFGSLCFEKHAFVKTALIVLIIIAIFLLGNFYSLKAMIPEQIMPGGLIYNWGFRVGGFNGEEAKGYVSLPEAWSDFVYWFLPVMLYILFWISSFFRMKEKQI